MELIRETIRSAELESIRNLTESMKWSTEQAMDMLGVNDSDRGILQKKL